MSALFKRGLRASTPLGVLVGGLQDVVNKRAPGGSLVQPTLARASFALESMSETQRNELSSSVDELNIALENVIRDHGQKGVVYGVSQMEAAQAAAISGSAVRDFLSINPNSKPALEDNTVYVPSTDGLNDRRAALEAYDERENKNAVIYSIAYNLQAARQDEFGETLFPTIVVTPDQVGLATSIRLVMVYDEVRRATTGALNDFKKRNILHAVIDPAILKNDQTKVIPVYAAGAEGNFVDATLLPTRVVKLDGEDVTTSALLFGKRFSLLGLSQTDHLLETGILDSTDALDSAVDLSSLYLRVQNAGATVKEIFKFNTNNLPTSNFVVAQQGNYRQLNLNFDTVDLMLDTNTKKVDGAASSLLGAALGVYTVRLAVSVSGSINQETGDTNLMVGEVSVRRITDAAGEEISTTAGAGQTIAALFDSGKAAFVGFDLTAQRTNSNRRQRGQLLDTTFFQQIYQVPLLAPITCPRPLTVGDQNDAADLAALITATRIRTSNEAVATLLRTAGVLQEIVKSNDKLENTPAILGVSRFLIKAFYEVQTLDLKAAVDSIKSHERVADVRATLVNLLRDMAYRMYRDTGYKAAADALAGGQSGMPTVIIATDPIIAQYLMVEGDFRTLGNDFQVKVVSTLNQTMKGKLFMTFGSPVGATEGALNPLHFGNMAWKPELTLVLPMVRNGSNSKELTVTPSFRHIVNLPALAQVNISNLSAVMTTKITMNTDEQAP